MLKYCVRVGLFSLLLTGLCFSSRVLADEDMDALKSAFTTQIDALNNRELDAAVATVHDDIVLYGIFSPFPVQGRADFQKAVQAYFGQYEEAELSPVTPQFRIVGTTALAWGHYQLAATPQGGKMTYAHGRYIFTYTKLDGKWVILGMDYSPLESYKFAP